jgi:demethylmenaquinone methyltransferase/2-methoxy-6-polyprenyl-1,4-benzoquinol methylase
MTTRRGTLPRMRTAEHEVSPRSRHALDLFAGLPPTYGRMGALWSMGQDPRWRRYLVSRVPPLPPGARVLDVATGTGLVASEVGRRTGAPVVGLDQSGPMIREGLRRSAGNGAATLLTFVLGRAEQLPFADASFDALTFTYLLRYVDDPQATLRELLRVVKPGGTVANLEFHVPQPAFVRGLWRLYTRGVLPMAGRLVSSPWYKVGRFLGPSISSFYRRYPLAEQLQMWRRAGVTDVRAKVMTFGSAVVIWGTKESGADDGH